MDILMMLILPWDLARSELCVSRGEDRATSWRTGVCSESGWEIINLGRVSVLGIWRLPGALKVPCRSVCSGGSGWSWVIWARVWPACSGRGTGARAVRLGFDSPRLGGAWVQDTELGGRIMFSRLRLFSWHWDEWEHEMYKLGESWHRVYGTENH